jgi:hypothetical protein
MLGFRAKVLDSLRTPDLEQYLTFSAQSPDSIVSLVGMDHGNTQVGRRITP